MKTGHIARSLIGVLAALALGGCGDGDNSAAATAQAYKLSTLRASGNIVSSAPLSATASIHVALVLKLNNEAELDDFCGEQGRRVTPASGRSLARRKLLQDTRLLPGRSPP